MTLITVLTKEQPKIPTSSDNSDDRAVLLTKPRTPRIPALDFIKGALVLIMVLYHWINYFAGPSDNRYLRFLTPSFIFITGFLISNVYFSKYGSRDAQLPKRLMQRGAKILGVFAALNLARVAAFPRTYGAQMLSEHSSLRSLLDIYVIGGNIGEGQEKAIAFFILVPISGLLLVSACLLAIGKSYRQLFHFVCALFFLSIAILYFYHYQSANLELIAVGMLGIAVGFFSMESLALLLKRPHILVLAYAGYLAAITRWNIIYPLQVVGVCLSLLLLYLLAGQEPNPGGIRRCVILLGKYSLLGYIAQIVILQVMHQGFMHTNLDEIAIQLISFVAAFALTIFAIEFTDRGRRRFPAGDRIYRAIFS